MQNCIAPHRHCIVMHRDKLHRSHPCCVSSLTFEVFSQNRRSLCVSLCCAFSCHNTQKPPPPPPPLCSAFDFCFRYSTFAAQFLNRIGVSGLNRVALINLQPSDIPIDSNTYDADAGIVIKMQEAHNFSVVARVAWRPEQYRPRNTERNKHSRCFHLQR